MIAFQRFLSEQLPQYYSNPTLTFLVAAISTPFKVPYLWSYPPISSFFGVVATGNVEEAKTVDSMSLNLFSFFFDLFGWANPYKQFFADFLTTEASSWHCALNGQLYSTATQLCLEVLDEYSDCNDASLTTWALECLSTLLDQSSKTEALVQAAQDFNFNPIVESDYAEKGFVAKAAIARYLSRCTNTPY